MFKQFVMASVILAASTSVAFADTTYSSDDFKGEIAPCPEYQFQAGPYLGLSVGPRVNFSSDPTSYVGIEGTLSGGYGAMMSPDFYLAGEIFLADSANVKDVAWQDTGVRSTWNYGLDIIPGYMLTDHFLGYLRAGVVKTKFKEQGDSSTGWQVGLGGQTNIYQNWDLRTEYIYSSYSSESGERDVSPQGTVFNVGIVYKFI